jgi:hypothetical protein
MAEAQKNQVDKDADKRLASERPFVVLKNGNGTVASEDYDEKLHGKALELTDEQFIAYVRSKPQGILAPRLEPPTSIPHLQTFKPVVAPTPVPAQLAPQPDPGQPVLTSADVERDDTLTDEGKERVDGVLSTKGKLTGGPSGAGPAFSIPGVTSGVNSVSEMGGSTKPPQPSEKSGRRSSSKKK